MTKKIIFGENVEMDFNKAIGKDVTAEAAQHFPESYIDNLRAWMDKQSGGRVLVNMPSELDEVHAEYVTCYTESGEKYLEAVPRDYPAGWFTVYNPSQEAIDAFIENRRRMKGAV